MNVLLNDTGSEISAILDWEMSREFHLPEVDLGHMINVLAAAYLKVEYGAGFVRFLQAPDLVPTASMLLQIRSESPNNLSDITILTLGWLDHIAMNLDKSDAYLSNSFWLAANVDVVLSALSCCREPGDVNAASDIKVRTSYPVFYRADEVVTRIASRRSSIPDVETSDIFTALASLTVLVALFRTNPEDVGDFGLAAAVPFYGLGAFIALTVLALHSTLRPDFVEGRAAATVASVVALISAAPGIVYETTPIRMGLQTCRSRRLSRSHRFAQPAGRGPRHLPQLAWTLHRIARARRVVRVVNALTIATWTPLVLNLLTLAGVVLVGSGLSDSRQNVWLGALLFFAANWIGQDYYSPQAVAYVLYLAIVGLVFGTIDPTRSCHQALRFT